MPSDLHTQLGFQAILKFCVGSVWGKLEKNRNQQCQVAYEEQQTDFYLFISRMHRTIFPRF
jgi:hypothetical protein